MLILDTYKKREIKGLQPNEIPNHSQLKEVIMKTSTKLANIPVWQNLSLKDLNGEKWVPIKGFEHLYHISNYGRIKSLKKQYRNGTGGLIVLDKRILKQTLNKKGYLRIRITDGNKKYTFRVHRLVAEAFVPNPKNKPEVNHINEIKTDNNFRNLNWLTRKENMLHGTTPIRISKTVGKPVSCFTKEGVFVKTYYSIKSTSEDGFSENSVCSCVNGKQKSHKGFLWKYEGRDFPVYRRTLKTN